MLPLQSEPTTSGVLEDLPFCLARATLAFRRFNDRSLRAVGLPSLAPGQASILHALQEEHRCTVNRLVEQTHLPNGTLTGLLDDLERKGYLARFPNPEDGRSWLVGLTAPGARLCRKLQKRHEMVMEMLGEALTSDEQDELVRLLGKITPWMREYRGTDSSNSAKSRKGSKE
jgi:DNA-binding MarR family transcriptional regulator